MSTFQAPRGMRDFYPADMALRNVIFDAWRSSAQAHGFEEYDASVVESLELLERKSGEEISTQIYDFTDKSDRRLCLRPEMTPTLARMVATQQGSLRFPLKWFTIAQCFRYERTTRGRKREHYQLNLDIIGETAVDAEVEVISTAATALFRLGLKADDIVISINSRQLLSELLEHIRIPSTSHQAVFLALDKRDKLPPEKLVELLTSEGLDEQQVPDVLSLLDIDSLDAATELLGQDTPGILRLKECMERLAAYGLADAVTFDISVIRGLGYYTGIVFECFDRQKDLRAIFGGGRYDNLLEDVGGKPQTAVGLGFGDVVLGEYLTDKGLDADTQTFDLAIGYMTADQSEAALKAARAQRESGETVDLALCPEKPKSFFGRVGKGSFRKALYIGPDDVAAGTARIKDLASGEQSEYPLS